MIQNASVSVSSLTQIYTLTQRAQKWCRGVYGSRSSPSCGQCWLCWFCPALVGLLKSSLQPFQPAEHWKPTGTHRITSTACKTDFSEPAIQKVQGCTVPFFGSNDLDGHQLLGHVVHALDDLSRVACPNHFQDFKAVGQVITRDLEIKGLNMYIP